MRRAVIAMLLAGAVSAVPAQSVSERAPAPSQSDAATRCAALLGQPIEGGAIESATLVPAGPYTEKTDTPGPTTLIPAHCRVRAVMRPSADSEILFELWLPAENWNGRFWGIGGGGFAGALILNEVATAVQYGYASFSTDTGHSSSTGTDKWARGHPEKVVDFGWRGVHVSTVAAKEITRRFYNSAAGHSYFSSCSTGGRQGLMEAQRFPEDYDGILAGAPSPQTAEITVAGFGWNAAALRAGPILPARVALLQSRVLEQCDKIDGVADGLIVNPAQCHVDLKKLECKPGQDASQCFSPAETETLAKLYSGPVDASGKSIYPGYSPGGEVGAFPGLGWEGMLFDDPADPKVSAETGLLEVVMRDFVTGDPGWTADRFDLARDYPLALRAVGSIIAVKPDYSAFARRGGKLMLWQGWSDPLIPPQATIRYREAIARNMGWRRTEGFSRLFMMPGTQHCGLGPGAWWANQGPAANPDKPETDMGAALQNWVETGRAPEEIVAIRPADPMSAFVNPKAAVAERSLRICAYPKYAKYDRKGDPKKAESYSCVAP
jgi:Tannase and feruloyl esterase